MANKNQYQFSIGQDPRVLNISSQIEHYYCMLRMQSCCFKNLIKVSLNQNYHHHYFDIMPTDMPIHPTHLLYNNHLIDPNLLLNYIAKRLNYDSMLYSNIIMHHQHNLKHHKLDLKRQKHNNKHQKLNHKHKKLNHKHQKHNHKHQKHNYQHHKRFMQLGHSMLKFTLIMC